MTKRHSIAKPVCNLTNENGMKFALFLRREVPKSL